MKKSDFMKKQAEKAYVIESIIDRIKYEMRYQLYEPVKDENGDFVHDENGDTIFELPDENRNDITWEFSYLTKWEREGVYRDVIAHIKNLLEKM